eukprot:1136835-Pelagomonas_calceolata.AAC.3
MPIDEHQMKFTAFYSLDRKVRQDTRPCRQYDGKSGQEVADLLSDKNDRKMKFKKWGRPSKREVMGSEIRSPINVIATHALLQEHSFALPLPHKL